MILSGGVCEDAADANWVGVDKWEWGFEEVLGTTTDRHVVSSEFPAAHSVCRSYRSVTPKSEI